MKNQSQESFSPCPQYGGKRVQTEVDAGGGPVRLLVRKNIWSAVATGLKAIVCIQCGLTNLYATNPAGLDIPPRKNGKE